ncbi:MAG: RNA polymerase sigma factor RpoD/SigA [Deltaproteobacteria bacterium]|nr:RNA polymerase sigma factor RpoD/SigA [Deltaproteobacteria bacterium]
MIRRTSTEGLTGKERAASSCDTDEIKEKGSINSYFGSIKNFQLLTHDEEIKLARKIARGDKAAREEMVKANLRLVVKISLRYRNRGLSFEDLVEEGNIGLIKAVERFNAAKGCRFSTYATFWIKQTIMIAIANQANTVRLPINITADIYRITRASKELMMTLHREPDFAEISEKTGLSGRYVKKLELLRRKSYSLESVLPDRSDQPLLDKIEDDRLPTPVESLERSDRVKRVNGLLGMLDDSERTVLKLRFGFDREDPKTLEEIGKAFGVTRERVRQIESKILGKLRKIIKRSDISNFDAI